MLQEWSHEECIDSQRVYYHSPELRDRVAHSDLVPLPLLLSWVIELLKVKVLYIKSSHLVLSFHICIFFGPIQGKKWQSYCLMNLTANLAFLHSYLTLSFFSAPVISLNTFFLYVGSSFTTLFPFFSLLQHSLHQLFFFNSLFLPWT